MNIGETFQIGKVVFDCTDTDTAKARAEADTESLYTSECKIYDVEGGDRQIAVYLQMPNRQSNLPEYIDLDWDACAEFLQTNKFDLVENWLARREEQRNERDNFPMGAGGRVSRNVVLRNTSQGHIQAYHETDLAREYVYDTEYKQGLIFFTTPDGERTNYRDTWEEVLDVIAPDLQRNADEKQAAENLRTDFTRRASE